MSCEPLKPLTIRNCESVQRLRVISFFFYNVTLAKIWLCVDRNTIRLVKGARLVSLYLVKVREN